MTFMKIESSLRQFLGLQLTIYEIVRVVEYLKYIYTNMRSIPIFSKEMLQLLCIVPVRDANRSSCFVDPDREVVIEQFVH